MKRGYAATLGVLTAVYLASCFEPIAYATLDDIEQYGSLRWQTELGDHLSTEERVRLSFMYGDLANSDFGGKTKGSVTSLAWLWGLRSPGHIRNIFQKTRYGETIYKITRLPSTDKIMDVWAHNQELIKIVVDRKGRISQREIARAFRENTGVQVATSTIVRALKAMKAEVARRRYKPLLSPAHRMARFFFGAKYIDDRFLYTCDVDEKWFYVVRVKGFVWILPDYMDACKVKALHVHSKRYITKVMFIVAVARPMYNEFGECIFDGKVGCWRICEYRQYKGNYNGKTHKHKKDDWYCLDVNMDADKYVEMMVGKLLPALAAIKAKYWDPVAPKGYQIRIQHDGAPGHRAAGIERHLEEEFASINAFFLRQPPKSPEVNMLDMAVFNSMAAHVAHFDWNTKSELVAAVRQAWAVLTTDNLEIMWACKCVTMRQLVFHNGCTISSAHVGLRKWFGKKGIEGRKALWAKVDRVCDGIDSCVFKS